MHFRRLSSLILPIAIILTTGVSSGMAHADTPQPPEPVDQHVLMVMDASGSMKEKTGGGQTRIAAAQKALHSVVAATPESTRLGLRIYGSQNFPEGSKQACTDSTLVVPLGTDNRAKLDTAINQYKPVGWTPMAYALEQAGKDVAKLEGHRTIVLVSDGEESCVPDPCPIAEKLAQQGIDLTLNTVGLNVSPKGRKQLQCIADKGHGEYYDATNAQQLTDALSQAARRAGQGFQIDAPTVQGGTSRSDATDVEPGSIKAVLKPDTDDCELGKRCDVQWYRIPRKYPTGTIMAGVIAQAGNKSQLDYLSAALYTSENDKCDAAADHSPVSSYLGARVFGIRVVSDPEESWCSDSPDEMYLKVEAASDTTKLPVGEQWPVRIHIAEEPPVTNADSLPAKTSTNPDWQKMPTQKATGAPVYGGPSFTTAKVLKPGNYPVQITEGETQIFAVDLDWGQRLQIQALGQDRRKDNGTQWVLDIFDPLGATMDTEWNNKTAFDDVTAPDSAGEVQLSSGTDELRYNDRPKNVGVRNKAILPGRYYFTVLTGQPEDATKLQEVIPWTFQVAVIGEAGTGAPQYDTSAPSATPTPSDTPSPTPSETPTTSATPQETSTAPSPATTPVASTEPKKGPNWPLIGGVAGTCVVLVGVGAFAALQLRKPRGR